MYNICILIMMYNNVLYIYIYYSIHVLYTIIPGFCILCVFIEVDKDQDPGTIRSQLMSSKSR